MPPVLRKTEIDLHAEYCLRSSNIEFNLYRINAVSRHGQYGRVRYRRSEGLAPNVCCEHPVFLYDSA